MTWQEKLGVEIRPSGFVEFQPGQVIVYQVGPIVYVHRDHMWRFREREPEFTPDLEDVRDSPPEGWR